MKWKMLLIACLFSGFAPAAGPATYYGAHLTSFSPWCCRLTVYNPTAKTEWFRLEIRNAAGDISFQQEYYFKGTMTFVFPTAGGVPAQPGEISIPPEEGVFFVETKSPFVKPKIAYRYGNSESLCEFLLPSATACEHLLPHSVQTFFHWTGVAVMNPYHYPIDVSLSALVANGAEAAAASVRIPRHSKYVRLAGDIWPGINTSQISQIRIDSGTSPVPPPMLIAGNNAQTRHVFFNAAARQESPHRDPVLGYLRLITAGFFFQGSLPLETCSQSDEQSLPSSRLDLYPFPHRFSHGYYIMETEVTRKMWQAVRDFFPECPADPTDYNYGALPEAPVQNLTWFEAVLFANLVSRMHNLYPCYYADAPLAKPIDTTNYTSSPVYFDPLADGYRLPTEGEWEYACRAGTMSPFSVWEPALSQAACGSCNIILPELIKVSCSCLNSGGATFAAASLAPNPLGLYDMHGNVSEWCWDWYAPYPSVEVTDYRGPDQYVELIARIHRGGNFLWMPQFMRSSHREKSGPDQRRNYIGFRLVRTALQ